MDKMICLQDFFKKKDSKYIMNCNYTGPDFINQLYQIQMRLGIDSTQFICYQDLTKPAYVNVIRRVNDETEDKHIKNFFLTDRQFNDVNKFFFPNIDLRDSDGRKRSVRVVYIKALFTNKIFENFYEDLRSRRNKISNDYYDMDRISI